MKNIRSNKLITSLIFIGMLLTSFLSGKVANYFFVDPIARFTSGLIFGAITTFAITMTTLKLMKR